MSKGPRSCQIIRGADGPTSVFIAGRKEKNPFRRLERMWYDRKYRRKKEKAERSIVPGSHTIQEVLQYAGEKYGMIEADVSCRGYERRKRDRRRSLIYRKRPDLLTEEKISPPEDFRDEKAVRAWEKQVQEQMALREKEADAIPHEVFPTDYHLFIADRGKQGTLEMEVDMLYGDIAVSCFNGSRDIMKPIVKDIYRYYGVSREDIANQTERYRELLAVLSM
ncbi:MAG: hypothetical protein NC341_01695 [Blautia sp.]|nr:hypothetical protein [Blautia sp.]MCM1200262.1 hypothetical protein [Bacteroides fragilis]